MHAVDDRLMESGACLAYQGHDPPGAVQPWSLPPGTDASTCMMSPSQLVPAAAAPPATAGVSSNGLSVTIMLQHCISTTATSTALIAIVAAAAAIYTCSTSSDQSSASSDDDIYGRLENCDCRRSTIDRAGYDVLWSLLQNLSLEWFVGRQDACMSSFYSFVTQV